MKRLFGYIALGVFTYLLFVVSTLPAQQALGLAAPRLKSQGVSLSASGVDGSAWSGRAAILSVNGVGLQSVHWELSPLALLSGRLGGDWSFQWQGARAEGHASAAADGEARLEAVRARFLAAELGALLPLPVSLGGEFALELERLELNGGRPVAAKGELLWRGAALRAPLEAALGDVHLVLSPREKGGIEGQISDGGGPLKIEGEVSLEPNGSYRLNALLGTRPGADASLKDNLPMVGQRMSDGRYRVVFNGRLKGF